MGWSRLVCHDARVSRQPELADWVSVDVETAGPVPGDYAMLTIGACLVDDPEQGFAAALIPDAPGADPAALAVTGLSLEYLQQTGMPAAQALTDLAQWLRRTVSGQPVMVGFNAPYDWMFISHYTHRYLGANPFGHSAIDIKTLAMGRFDLPWSQTSFSSLARRVGLPDRLSHEALADARQQAVLLRHILGIK